MVKARFDKRLGACERWNWWVCDARGKISNFELTEPINMVGLIDSKKGTIRANHYHPQQEQKCLFTKGQIIEIFQDILNPNSPKVTQVVNEGTNFNH